MPNLLSNPVQEYAWGSRTTIPELLGAEPTGRPQAELWMGAHERGPSRLATGDTLYDVTAADPDRVLGPAVAARFGGRFPFLAKILAAAQPLSIQAHPSAEQARAGFAAEDAAGVPRDAADRNYRDPWPKPEMLVALGTFDALVGFRPVDQTVALLDALGGPALGGVADSLREGSLREAFMTAMQVSRDAVRPVLVGLGAACRDYAGTEFELAAATLNRLCQDFPDDPGVLAALLLNRVRLNRFEAVYLPAGNVHAYLAGHGFEVMANSDNVLRGGLTRKHVDLPELVSVVDFEPLADPVLRGTTVDGLTAYDVGCEYFDLRRVDVDGVQAVPGGGPRIVACLEGAFDVDTGDAAVPLGPGRSVFADATEGPCSLRGRGVGFVVSVPEELC